MASSSYLEKYLPKPKRKDGESRSNSGPAGAAPATKKRKKSGLVIHDEHDERTGFRQLDEDQDEDGMGAEEFALARIKMRAAKRDRGKDQVMKKLSSVGSGLGNVRRADEGPTTADRGVSPKVVVKQEAHPPPSTSASPPSAQPDTVYRSASGRQTSAQSLISSELAQRASKAEAARERYEWGKGSVTTSSVPQTKISKQHLAKYADDPSLNAQLRATQRWGDPGAMFMKTKPPSAEDEGARKAKREPTYEGDFPPNRFGIRPGYRWDGVVRSNGFEEQWFKTQATKEATKEKAYKWSTEDM